MARSNEAKQALRKEAEQHIAGRDDVELALDETTGANDFKHQFSPDVRGVVVDCNSEPGCVQISGVGNPTIRITTGPGESGFRFEAIPEGQSCMLYGCSTVWYIIPRS